MHPWSPKDFKSPQPKALSLSEAFDAFDFKDTALFSIPRMYDSHIHLQGLGKFSGERNLSHCRSLADVQQGLQHLIRILPSAPHSKDARPTAKHYIEAFGLKADGSIDFKELCLWAKQVYPHIIFGLVLEDGHSALFTGEVWTQAAQTQTLMQAQGQAKVQIQPQDLGQPKAQTRPQDLKAQSQTQDLGQAKTQDLRQAETQVFQQKLNWISEEDGTILGVLAEDTQRPVLEKLISQWVGDSKSNAKIKQDLLIGQKILIQNGFSHCRDMTSDPVQFQTLLELEQSQEFFIYTDLYFSNFKGESLESLLQHTLAYKKQSSRRVQLKGVKIFLDGTLSGNSLDCSCAQLSTKTPTYNSEDIYEILKAALDSDLEVAFHCIGDLAFEKIVLALKKLALHTQGRLPLTHFEHCQFINDQSLKYLTELKEDFPQSYLSQRLYFHFQPSHWISDHSKVPMQAQNLHFFAWELLLQRGFPHIYFGSDAPVLPPVARLDLWKDLCSFLEQKKWASPWWTHFVYPDRQRGSQTFTLFSSLPKGHSHNHLHTASKAQRPESSFPDFTGNIPNMCKVFIDGKLISL